MTLQLSLRFEKAQRPVKPLAKPPVALLRADEFLLAFPFHGRDSKSRLSSSNSPIFF